MNIQSIKRMAVNTALATETFDDSPTDNYREYIFSADELQAFADAIIKAYKREQAK
jgi:hypothetical protein